MSCRVSIIWFFGTRNRFPVLFFHLEASLTDFQWCGSITQLKIGVKWYITYNSKGIIMMNLEIIPIKRFYWLNACTRTQDAPEKVFRLEPEGKSVQGLYKLANWNRDMRKLKNSISQLLMGVQSSITTLKCSEDSYYGVRIRVSKSSDFPFPSYGQRPFFGLAIYKKYHISASEGS